MIHKVLDCSLALQYLSFSCRNLIERLAMTPLSIFVSYHRNDTGFAQSLIEALRSAGATVMDDPDGVYGPLLERMLSQCQWFIVVQTPDAVQSSHVLFAMIAALSLEAQGKIEVLRIVAPLSSEPPTWSHTSEIELGDDYLSVGNNVLNKLGLNRVERYSSTPSPALTSQHNPVGCIFLVLIACAFIFGGIYYYPTIASYNSKNPGPPSDPSQVYTWATNGQPFFADSLTSQDDNNWSENVDRYKGSCKFINGAYYAESPTSDWYNFCGASADKDSNFGNFAFQVQMTILQGDGGGLVFRANQSLASNNNKFYAFTISQGYYKLVLCQKHCLTLKTGSSTAIKNGTQTNLLTVVAFGSDMYFYINTQFVTKVSNTTMSSGYIGMTAYDYSYDTKIKFSQAEVWKL